MLTVKLIFLDGTSDLRDCWDVSELCLDGVLEIRIIRDDRTKAA